MAEETQRTFNVLSNGVGMDQAANLKRFQVENLLVGLGVKELSNEWNQFFKGIPITINGEQIQLDVVGQSTEPQELRSPSTYRLSPDMAEEMVLLDKRGRSLGARGICLFGLGGALGVAALVTYAFAQSSAPSAALKALHVPDELYKRFSDWAVDYGSSRSISGQIGSGLEGVSNLSETVVSFMSGPAIFATGVIAIVGFLCYGLFSANLGKAFKMAVPVFLAVCASQIVGVFFGATNPARSPVVPSERVQLANAVEDHKTKEILRLLSQLRGDWKELYLTAQVYLLDGSGSAASVKQAAESLRTYSNEQLGFTPSGDVVYAIEQAADGKVKTPVAQGYFEAATQSAITGKRRAAGMGIAAMIFAVLGGGVMVLAVNIRRRVSRIKALAMA